MRIASTTFYLRDGPGAIIRSVQEAEAGQVLALQKLLARETEYYGRTPEEIDEKTEYWQLGYINRMNSDTTSAMLGCYVEGKPVGIGKIWFETRTRECHRATISVAVLESFWGRGVGTNLIHRLIEVARYSKVITQVELQVVASNRRAIRLYRKIGFKKVAQHPNAVKLKDGKYYPRNHMVYTL